jgi:hypothetical protein
VIVVPFAVKLPVCVSIPFVAISVLVRVVVPLFCKNLVVGVASWSVIVVPFAVKLPVWVSIPFVPIPVLPVKSIVSLVSVVVVPVVWIFVTDPDWIFVVSLFVPIVVGLIVILFPPPVD